MSFRSGLDLCTLCASLPGRSQRNSTGLASWLNDGAKGFLIGFLDGGVIYTAPGIVVRRPALAQLLAMKLSAWRDDVDIQDATRLLTEMMNETRGKQERVWGAIEPYITPGQQLKARYAFLDLWESLYGDN